jgi:lipid-A-disaccharide synthase
MDTAVAASGMDRGVQVHAGDYPAIVSSCAAGIVASGTATLEAAMTGLPMVVAYRLAPATYWIARRFVRLPHVAMPNLVAGREVVPERIQAECRGDLLARDVAAYLDDPDRVRAVREGLSDVRRRLGEPGACERAAEAVLEVAEARRSSRGDG